MTEVFDFAILTGSVKPFLVVLFFLIGYVVTDKFYLHDAIKWLKGKKEWAVGLFSLPFAVLFIATGEDWQTVTVSYLVTNAIYDYILKHFKIILP